MEPGNGTVTTSVVVVHIQALALSKVSSAAPQEARTRGGCPKAKPCTKSSYKHRTSPISSQVSVLLSTLALVSPTLAAVAAHLPSCTAVAALLLRARDNTAKPPRVKTPLPWAYTPWGCRCTQQPSLPGAVYGHKQLLGGQFLLLGTVCDQM